MFHVKKGSADPFRGNWYVHESSFPTVEEAVSTASELTQQNYLHWLQNWDEHGFEWSVFEETPSGEKKIWEGFKAASLMRSKAEDSFDEKDGWL